MNKTVRQAVKVVLCAAAAVLLLRLLSALFFTALAISSSKPWARSNVYADFTILSRTDISQGADEVLYNVDTHGGFHGDGNWIAAIRYTDDALLNDISASPEWRPLPLSEPLREAARLFAPRDEAIAVLLPKDYPDMANGWYFFLDRHRDPDNTDPKDDSRLHSRHSYNYTLAVYDPSARILYIFEEDT